MEPQVESKSKLALEIFSPEQYLFRGDGVRGSSGRGPVWKKLEYAMLSGVVVLYCVALRELK